MKFSALLFAAFVLSSSVCADVGSVYSFGRGNVTAGSLSNSTKLDLVKRLDDDRYYLFQCKKSGLLSKNLLSFQVIDKNSKEAIVSAESKVDDCKEQLRNIYKIAFERNAQIVVALTEEANENGVYGLNISQNFTPEVVH